MLGDKIKSYGYCKDCTHFHIVDEKNPRNCDKFKFDFRDPMNQRACKYKEEK